MRDTPETGLLRSTDDDLVRDHLFAGRVTLWQPRRGWRFAVDAPLLAAFACETPGPVDTVVDLGAGCGVIGLTLLVAEQARKAILVEFQPRLARLCHDNARANGLTDRCVVVEGDVVAELPAETRASLVVSNPPFWPVGDGQLPEDPERRLALHESIRDLAAWIGAAARILDPRRGRLLLVFPARRLDDLCTALRQHRLAPRRLKFVHPRPGGSAEWVLVEARPAAGGKLVVEAPLVLRLANGKDARGLTRILNGEFAPALAGRPDLR